MPMHFIIWVAILWNTTEICQFQYSIFRYGILTLAFAERLRKPSIFPVKAVVGNWSAQAIILLYWWIKKYEQTQFVRERCTGNARGSNKYFVSWNALCLDVPVCVISNRKYCDLSWHSYTAPSISCKHHKSVIIPAGYFKSFKPNFCLH